MHHMVETQIISVRFLNKFSPSVCLILTEEYFWGKTMNLEGAVEPLKLMLDHVANQSDLSWPPNMYGVKIRLWQTNREFLSFAIQLQTSLTGEWWSPNRTLHIWWRTVWSRFPFHLQSPPYYILNVRIVEIAFNSNLSATLSKDICSVSKGEVAHHVLLSSAISRWGDVLLPAVLRLHQIPNIK